MKKRLLTILLTALLTAGLLSAPALAAGGPLAADRTEAFLGDTLVLTFTQQETQTVSALVFSFDYNQYALELTRLDTLPYCDLVPDVADCNACGSLSFGYTDPTYEAATVIPAGTVLLKAVFKVIADDWGDLEIRMSSYQVAGVLDEYGLPEMITPALTPEERTVVVPVAAHTHAGTLVAAVPASCEHAGSSAYYTCTCGRFFADAACTSEIAENSWIIPATGHTPGAAVKENETMVSCTAAGGYDTVVYCTTCRAELSREHTTIPATGHTPGAAVKENEISATCTAAGGYDAVVYCTTCRAELSRSHTTIPATGHSYGAWTVKTPAKCTEAGTETRTCAHDASHVETRTIPALGHNWGAWTVVTAATETTDGQEMRTCSRCTAQETRAIPALGHTHVPVKTEAKAASCEAAGNTAYWTCSGCGRYFSDAACTSEIDLEDTVIPATGHAWGAWTVTTPAKCTEAGTETRTCAHDASHVETRTIPATGHTPGAAVKENEISATCTAAGGYDAVVYCTTCRAELSRSHTTIPATGHAYGAPTYTWAADNSSATGKVVCAHDASHVIVETVTPAYKVLTAPTETTQGSGRYTATFADTHFTTQTKDVTIPNLAHVHTLVKTAAAPASCTEAGHTEYWTCSGCGKVFADAAGTRETTLAAAAIPAKGHTPGTAQRENEVPATCTAAGSYDEVVYCSECHEELSRVTKSVERLSHVFGDWVVTIPATETEPGEETRCCENCDAFETRPIPPTGHEESYVERAYRLILGRPGDEEGIAHWNAELSGGASAGGIIRDFFRSEEYLSRGLTDAQTVALCYQAMLSRDPAPDEVANWTAMLADGYSTTKLVAEFVASPEFASICADYGLTAGTIELSARDVNGNITRFVERCYLYTLERGADEGGLNEWCAHLLTQDLTPERVAFGFVFSNEAKGRGLDDEEFIAMLYRMMLDREPDEAGLANWAGALRQNTAAEIAYDAAFETGRSEADAIDQTRQNIYALFAASEEFGLMIRNFGF